MPSSIERRVPRSLSSQADNEVDHRCQYQTYNRFQFEVAHLLQQAALTTSNNGLAES